jgi:hypothetical protein
MRFCEEARIPCVQYLPYYAGQDEWEKKHFGQVPRTEGEI